MRLTKAIIDKTEYEGSSYSGRGGSEKWSRFVLWDDGVRGLGLRITPRGVKTFVLSYRAGNAKRLMKIGRYGPLTLHDARDMAEEKLRMVARGMDPLQEVRRKKLEAQRAKTVGELAERFLDDHARPNKKSWREDERRIEKHILPEFGHLKIEELTKERVRRYHQLMGAKHPYEANRVINLLSAIFNLAESWGLLADGTPNPAKLRTKERFRESRRDRPITSDEMPRLLEAIEAEGSVHIRGLFRLLILTGLRKNELARSRWQDVDLKRGTLRLPDTKAGSPRHVPLSAAATEMMRSLPREQGNPYLFPSPVRKGRPVSDLQKPWKRITTAAKCVDLRIHDIRHSVATWLAEAGNPAQVIQGALGHQDLATTMGYVHASDTGARAALDGLANEIGGDASSR